jgi:hypothetical protein
MISVTINDVNYSLCSEWSEVDLPKLLAATNFKEDLLALSDLPKDLVELATDLQLFPLYTIISFIDDLQSIEMLPATSVAQGEYGQLEFAKQILQSDKREAKKLLTIAMEYHKDEKNPVRLLGLGADIVSQIAKFLSHYKEMMDHEPDMEEEAAGIESLSDFGSFGTVYNLAQKDITKVRTIYAMKAIDVYTAIHFGFRENKYMTELAKIKQMRQ